MPVARTIMCNKSSTKDKLTLGQMLKNTVRNDPKAGIWIVSFIAGLITFPLMFLCLWWVTGNMVPQSELVGHLIKLAVVSGVVSCLVIPSVASCARVEKMSEPADPEPADPASPQVAESSSEGIPAPKTQTEKATDKKSRLAELRDQMTTVNTEAMGEVTTTFDDIAGYAETKKNMEFIVRCLQHPEQLKAVGGKIPNGILLYGPPGTGKTLMARALAGTAGVKFYAANASEFVNIWVGQGATNVRALYAEAKKNAPSIVFIDEIDALGGARSPGQHQEYRQTLNALLSEMDGMDKDSGVLTIAATNVLEELDQALIRPGRFDRKIAIPLPNYDDRLAIIRLYAKKRSMTEDVSLEAIARQTVGMSGSSINTLFNEASIQAVMGNRSVITREDIDMALTQMITNGEISKMVDKDELEMVAYHEAGHALLARLVANDPVQKVTIIGNTAGALGITIHGGNEQNLLPLETLRGRAIMCYGGRAAEEIVFGKENISTGASQDLKDASRYIRAYIECGAGKSLLNESSFAGQNMIPDTKEAKELSAQFYDEAVKVLTENRHLLDRIAKALLEKETLMEDDFEALFE